jgi:hypothetical protein
MNAGAVDRVTVLKSGDRGIVLFGYVLKLDDPPFQRASVMINHCSLRYQVHNMRVRIMETRVRQILDNH